MIRAVTGLRGGGMAILLGVTEANIERLKDDQPIDVDLSALMIEATGKKLSGSRLRLVITYGKTHRAIVDAFEQGGLPLPPDAAEQADAIDASL